MTPTEIKATRIELNMTQAELAAEFETDATTIARWERGERTPAMPGMLRLAFRTLATDRAAKTSLTDLIKRNVDGLQRTRVRHAKFLEDQAVAK